MYWGVFKGGGIRSLRGRQGEIRGREILGESIFEAIVREKWMRPFRR